jgi:hypothetical protein
MRQAQAGMLKAERVGKLWLVTDEEMRRYMREHARRPGRKPKDTPRSRSIIPRGGRYKTEWAANGRLGGRSP